MKGTTGIDDSGEQSKRARSLLAAGAETQATSTHPVAQQTFGGVVGERQAGVEQRPDDRFPVVQHLPAAFAEFGQGTVWVEFAPGRELGQGRWLLFGQVLGRALAGGLDQAPNRSRSCWPT